ncbi:MAG TPA: hypothetical protein VIF15_21855 [Polyangiaceae bacterium]|jgi:hypothetical protein
MRSIRKPLLVLTLLGMAIAVPALAQQTAGYPAACDASKVSKGDVDRAHTVYLSGKQFLDESNYDKAISYFKDAYSIDCSVHGILPIIATAYERKGDKASAVGALQEYVKRAPTAPDREVIERRIKNLQDQLSHEQPTATTATAPTATGTTAPTATGTGEPTATATATAPTGTATGAPPPDTGGGHTLTPWIVAGAGGVLVVTGVVLLIVGSGDVTSAANACPTRIGCKDSIASQGNDGRTLEAVGGVVTGVGALGVAGGLLWHFLEKPAAPAPAGASLNPVVAPGYAGVSLGGAF